jgi:hypothetical protein
MQQPQTIPTPLRAFDLAHREALDDSVSIALSEAMSDGTVLTVTQDRPAQDVARLVDATNAISVVVVDVERHVVGYIFPESIARQVAAHHPATASLSDAVEALSTVEPAAAQLPLARRLDFARPALNLCPGKLPAEGAHFTLGPTPCARHR